MASHQPGFTLLELLVAIAIFAVIGVLAYAGLDRILSANNATIAHNKKFAEVQKAIALIERDMRFLIDRSIRDYNGTKRASVLLSARNLEFTRGGWNNPLNQPRSNLQRVSYSYQNNQLIRQHWMVLDQAQDSYPVEKILLQNVEWFVVRILASDDKWYTTWPGESNNIEPKAISIVLQINELGSIERVFELTNSMHSIVAEDIVNRET